MGRQIQISEPLQIVIEGKDGLIFMETFVEHNGLADVQVHDFGGVTELGAYLKALSAAPGFAATVEALAVIRDAERDANGAFRSACGTLRKAGLPIPGTPEEVTESSPKVGIFILPDGREPGMLETLCLRSVAEDPAMDCVGRYLNCLAKIEQVPVNKEKARAQAFLASRPRPGVPLGVAARRGYWQLSHPCFDALRQFLRELHEDSPAPSE